MDSGQDGHDTTAWRRRVAEAARRGADQLRAENDPLHEPMIADLEDLHARLTATEEEAE